jgi:hypothetical protein
MEPDKFIKLLRDTDNYIECIFTMGGCYKFASLLTEIYPDSPIYINDTKDHVATLINGVLYDIKGEIKFSEFFKPITPLEEDAAKEWSFQKQNYLIVNECPNCEEPITFNNFSNE